MADSNVVLTGLGGIGKTHDQKIIYLYWGVMLYYSLLLVINWRIPCLKSYAKIVENQLQVVAAQNVMEKVKLEI